MHRLIQKHPNKFSDGKYALLIVCAILVQLSTTAIAQESFSVNNQNLSDIAYYNIKLCTDVPHPANPDKVYYKGETGHVFIRLEKNNNNGEIIESLEWGFYPAHPVTTIMLRKAKSKLSTNRGRKYDASITCKLTAIQYEHAIQKALELSKKKYHLNNFNCYHYAIQVFNSVSSDIHIPEREIRFPLIAGKGGSPCALFADLKKLSNVPMPETYVIDFPGTHTLNAYSSISSLK